MRKFLLVMCFILFLPIVSYADNPITLFTNVTSTGAGASVWVADNTITDWTCDVDTTGSPTAVTIRIEGNMGGTVFDPTGMAVHVFTATQISANKATFGIVDSGVVNIRANLITLTGGTNPTVSAVCGGNKQYIGGRR